MDNGQDSKNTPQGFGTSDIPTIVTPKKRRRVLKTVLLVVLILIVGYFSLPYVLGLLYRDIKSVNDEDLLFQKVVISDEQNSYFDLMGAADVFSKPSTDKAQLFEDIKDDETWDQVFVDELLHDNESALEFFSLAAGKPYFQNPAISDPINISPNVVLPPLVKFRDMGHLSAIKSLSLAKKGDGAEAIQEASKSLAVAQKIQDSHVFLIEYLTTLPMKARAWKVIQTIVATTDIDSSILSLYAKDLKRYSRNDEGLISAFKSEYQTQKWIVDAMTTKDKEKIKTVQETLGEDFERTRPSFQFQPNATKVLFAEYARTQINDSERDCGSLELKNAESALPSYASKPGIISSTRLYFTKNVIGSVLHDIVAGSYGAVQLKRCQADFLAEATRLYIAIKAFFEDNGTYPESLIELVPQYIDSIPDDPFSDGALKYDSQKKVIYSEGEILRKQSTDEHWKNLSQLQLEIDF